MGSEISCLVRKMHKRKKKSFSVISGWNLMGLPALIIAIKVHCLVQENSELSTMGEGFFLFTLLCVEGYSVHYELALNSFVMIFT